MQRARFVALRTVRAVFPRHLQFAASRRPLRVDTAMRGDTDLALQRDAARLFLPSAAHATLMRAEGFGELDRHPAAEVRFGFGPVHADAVGGATGAAGQTGVSHRGVHAWATADAEIFGEARHGCNSHERELTRTVLNTALLQPSASTSNSGTISGTMFRSAGRLRGDANDADDGSDQSLRCQSSAAVFTIAP
jgi:hypothetical protein